MQENNKKAGNSFMTKLATFIVDKRNLFFLLTTLAAWSFEPKKSVHLPA